MKLITSRALDNYDRPFTHSLSLTDSEFNLYVSHCFDLNRSRDVSKVFEEDDVKQRIVELLPAKELPIVRLLVDEISRATLAADVEEIFAKFEGQQIQTLIAEIGTFTIEEITRLTIFFSIA